MNYVTCVLPRQVAAVFTVVLIAGMFAVIQPAVAADPPIYAKRGIAIKGADPVAYFTQGKPVSGSKKFETEWMGAKWRFASAQNRDMFQANPEKYAPQYGGYCSYAVSQGYTAKIEKDAWAIVGGKLYLNYSKSVRRIWESDIPGHISSANENWPDILN